MDNKFFDGDYIWDIETYPNVITLAFMSADKKYKLKEINLMPGEKSNLSDQNKVLTGDYLMKVGLDGFTTRDMNSRIIELTAE